MKYLKPYKIFESNKEKVQEIKISGLDLAGKQKS